MNRESGKRSSLTAKAEAAFEQASRKVVERAMQTKTPVVVWKNGQVVEIPSEKVENATLQGPQIEGPAGKAIPSETV
jgi:hypothetical protein